MGLFGAKPKEVAVAPTHGRVDDSTPRSMERQPTALRKQKSNLGPAGKMSRQLTRKMTAQKMEAEVAAAQHLHSKECDALVKNMRTLEGEMRKAFTDTTHTLEDFKKHASDLDGKEGVANEAAKLMHEFNEEMEGDFRLLKRKPDWGKAITLFQSACLGQNKDVAATTAELSKYLTDIIAIAEPETTPSAVAIIMWHPSDNSMLKVFYATDAAEIQMGKTISALNDNAATVVYPVVWKVMKGADAELANPHGLERTAKEGRSVCPLKSTAGNTFGCVVSGPPAVPDELLESLCRQAGPLLENVWKMEKACEAIDRVIAFITKAASFNKQLVYPLFEKGVGLEVTRPGANGDTWNWQPLMHLGDSKSFVLPLKWKLGDPIGVLRISCGSFTKIDEQLTVLLMVMTTVLEEAISEIEGLTPGDAPPLGSMDMVLAAYEKTRIRAPKLMQDEIMEQMRLFDAMKVFAELRFLGKDVVDEGTVAMIQAVLVMVGHKRKDIKEWKAIQVILKGAPRLHEGMIELQSMDGDDASQHHARFDEASSCTKNVDLEELTTTSVTQAAVLLIRWLQAVRSTHSIATAIAAEAKPPPPDPVADGIFDQIDTDKSGTIDAKELVTYMVTQYSNKMAHTLLRVLDADADKSISRDEWRRGWADGLLDQVLMAEHAKQKEKAVEGGRLARKRGTVSADAQALAISMAARQVDPERLKEIMGEADKKPKSASKKGSKSDSSLPTASASSARRGKK